MYEILCPAKNEGIDHSCGVSAKEGTAGSFIGDPSILTSRTAREWVLSYSTLRIRSGRTAERTLLR